MIVEFFLTEHPFYTLHLRDLQTYIEYLSESLENKILNDWEEKWSTFGTYDPLKNNRRSKFYETLASEISDKSGIKISRDTIHRFDNGEGGNSKYTLESISTYLELESFEDYIQASEKPTSLFHSKLGKGLQIGLLLIPVFFLSHRFFVRPTQIKNNIEKTIIAANEAQFKAFKNLDTTSLGQYYVANGAALKSIVCVINENKKVNRSISLPGYNPSFYDIMSLRVVEVRDTTATAITEEHWLIKWYDQKKEKYTVGYDVTNKQYYELKLVNKQWKIDHNIYEGKATAIDF
ncbi:hypothetical protein SAMN06298216_2733 [Spirosomataceae bacterium TFI 002]|nr:hypothetical protein SAMN06298216_2733 [Spirosomataceae bacterium TFI 002]